MSFLIGFIVGWLVGAFTAQAVNSFPEEEEE